MRKARFSGAHCKAYWSLWGPQASEQSAKGHSPGETHRAEKKDSKR